MEIKEKDKKKKMKKMKMKKSRKSSNISMISATDHILNDFLSFSFLLLFFNFISLLASVPDFNCRCFFRRESREQGMYTPKGAHQGLPLKGLVAVFFCP